MIKTSSPDYLIAAASSIHAHASFNLSPSFADALDNHNNGVLACCGDACNALVVENCGVDEGHCAAG